MIVYLLVKYMVDNTEKSTFIVKRLWINCLKAREINIIFMIKFFIQ